MALLETVSEEGSEDSKCTLNMGMLGWERGGGKVKCRDAGEK